MRITRRIAVQQGAVVAKLLVQLGGELIASNAIAQSRQQFTSPHRHTERNTR